MVYYGNEFSFSSLNDINLNNYNFSNLSFNMKTNSHECTFSYRLDKSKLFLQIDYKFFTDKEIQNLIHIKDLVNVKFEIYNLYSFSKSGTIIGFNLIDPKYPTIQIKIDNFKDDDFEKINNMIMKYVTFSSVFPSHHIGRFSFEVIDIISNNNYSLVSSKIYEKDN